MIIHLAGACAYGSYWTAAVAPAIIVLQLAPMLAVPGTVQVDTPHIIWTAGGSDLMPSIGSVDQANALARKGIDAYKGGRYDLAVKHFSDLLTLKPNDSRIYFNRGIAYSKLSDDRRAADDFSAAIRLNPAFVLALINRGNILSKRKNYSLALMDYNAAAVLDPRNGNIFYNRGIAYGGLRNFEAAIDDFTEAIRRNPKDLMAYSARADAFSALGRTTEARKDYHVVLTLDPSNLRAIQKLREWR